MRKAFFVQRLKSLFSLSASHKTEFTHDKRVKNLRKENLLVWSGAWIGCTEEPVKVFMNRFIYIQPLHIALKALFDIRPSRFFVLFF